MYGTENFFMNLTAMSALIIFIFCAADILPRVFEKTELNRGKTAYFVLCVWVLRMFRIKFLPEFTLNISCIIILTACAVLKACREQKGVLKTLLSAAFCASAAAFYNSVIGESEISMLLFALLNAVSGLAFGGPAAAFACSAAVPVSAEILRFILELCRYGYGALELTENIVDAQMAGIVFSAVLYEIHVSLKAFWDRRKQDSRAKAER